MLCMHVGVEKVCRQPGGSVVSLGATASASGAGGLGSSTAGDTCGSGEVAA